MYVRVQFIDHKRSEEEINAAIRYRFSGFQFPLIQLDETGPAYIWLKAPPGFLHPQPEYWAKPSFQGTSIRSTSERSFTPNTKEIKEFKSEVKTENKGNTKNIKLYPILPHVRK